MVLAPALERERIICQFLRDAPHLVGASGLGAATCTLTPWLHQQTVARRLIESFPARCLLADEVGLGKTIEAGLMLRQLWLSGVVRRALILAPKSVLRQWQEELYEKFVLNAPIYDGGVFRDIWEEERASTTPDPWDDVELALGQQPEMFGDETYPVAFDEQAVVGLKRHGYPWAPLLNYAYSHIQTPRPTAPFFVEVQGDTASRLKQRFGRLKRRATQLVEEIAEETR